MPAVVVVDRTAGQNSLLASLPAAEYERLLPVLEPAPLVYRDVLYRPGEPIRHVYFPLSGIISQIVVMEDGAALETLTVGREGMVGVQVFLGTAVAPNLALVQMAGDALRMNAEDLLQAARGSDALGQLLLRYSITLLNQTARGAACNRLHTVEQRLARWLLLAQDRTEVSVLPFTQDFLALMLGVRRASVAATAASLQRANLIRYRRGGIEILDSPGLEAAACECYGVMRRAARLSLPD